MYLKKITYFIFLVLMGGAAQAKPLMYLPFNKGESWYCVQGPGGSYSHSGKLKYSFDFDKGSSENSSNNPAFDEWIFSPVRGEVIRVVNSVPDFQYNNSSQGQANNYGYGNEVTIKVASADFEALPYYVRILHLKQGSAVVKMGETVEIGAPLGRVGQTGFSSHPHLHIHLSQESTAGDSLPFDFVEGPVTPGNWYESAITAFSNLLDNDKSSNLGNHFLWKTTAKSSYLWYKQTEGNFTGQDHMISFTPWAKFKWKFKLAKPGYFLVMARYSSHPLGDPKALYRVIGNKYYVDQSSSTEDGWRILGFKYLPSPGFTYQISLEATTPGRRVSADAIDLIRVW